MKSLNYLKLMVTKKNIINQAMLCFVSSLFVFGKCGNNRIWPYESTLQIQGKIPTTIYPEGKTTFKVGDSIRIVSRFNAQDLDHWNKYDQINYVYSNMYFYTLDTVFKPSGEIETLKDILTKRSAFWTKEYTAEFIENPHIVFKSGKNNEVTNGPKIFDKKTFVYDKQNDGSHLLEVTIYFKKPAQFVIAGITSNYNEATYNKYEAATEEERRKGVRVQLYVGKEHTVVPVVFTNNNQNYVPITVTE